MKKLIGLALLASAWLEPARACDVCGGSASNQSLGVLPDAAVNFAGIQYLRNSFRSEHPSLFENRPDERSRDYYNSIQLWGRYTIANRVQLFAFVPYRDNIQQTDTGSTRGSGPGDVTILANGILLRDRGGTEGWAQQLLAGGGVKLPTGAYTGITDRDRQGLPNMQPGSGSWDVILNTNYTLRRRSSGLNVDASYTLTTANTDRYKYGNRLAAGLLLFRSWTWDRLRLSPQIGARYEYALHDYDNYERRWLNTRSGGYMSFATLGVQAFYGRIGARCSYQRPVSQHYANGNVQAMDRIDAGVFLLF